MPDLDLTSLAERCTQTRSISPAMAGFLVGAARVMLDRHHPAPPPPTAGRWTDMTADPQDESR